MLVTLYISSYNTYVCMCMCMYIRVCLHMHACSMYAHTHTHTHTKFLSNYKNCAVPSVVIVVPVESEWRLPSLSHPQDNAVCILVGACLLRPRARERRRRRRCRHLLRAMQQNVRVCLLLYWCCRGWCYRVTLPFSLLAPTHTHTHLRAAFGACLCALSRALSPSFSLFELCQLTLSAEQPQRVQCVRFVVRIVTRAMFIKKFTKIAFLCKN